MTLGAEILATRPSTNGITLDVLLREQHLLLQGHFPGLAILPAVGQLHWAVQAARNFLAVPGRRVGFHFLKFNRLIRPLGPLRLTLQRGPEATSVNFQLSQFEQECASGQIRFADE